LFPPVPLTGIHSVTFKLLTDSNKCIYIGIKRGEFDKKEDQWLGHLENEWSVNIERATWHHTRNENKYGKALKKNDTITIILDWEKGVLSYKIWEKNYGEAFKEDIFKTGNFFFSVSMYVKD